MALQCATVEEAGSLPSAKLTGRDKRRFRHNTYMYILYLRSEDNILAILCMGLPITTTTAGQWLNNSMFHTDIKFIIKANGQTIIYVGADHIRHIIYFTQKLLGSTELSLMITTCLWLCTVM